MTAIVEYSNQDFINAINREIAKRETTYPKILAKMEKNGCEPEEKSDALKAQNFQIYNLKNALYYLENNFITSDEKLLSDLLAELKREMKMRQKCYSRWVWLYNVSGGKRGISQETATFEKHIWKTIIAHFENQLP